MRSFLLVFLALLIIVYTFNVDLGYAGGESPYSIDYSAEYSLDDIIVEFKPDCSMYRINEICEELDILAIKEIVPNKSLYLFTIPLYKSVEVAIVEISRYNEVDYAQPNYMRRLEAVPNDTYYAANQSSYMNVIDAPEAWDTRTNANSIVVAVIDGGVDTTHPDLDGNLWTNSGEIPGNGIDDDSNGFIDDVNGWNVVDNNNNYVGNDGVAGIEWHGTFIAGVIGAEGNNATGIAGVCWNTKIMALAAASSDGYMYSANLVEALNYCNNNGANIVNLSWGGGSFSQAESDAILDLGNNNVLFVTAAGNDTTNLDSNIDYPTWYGHSNIISTAATTTADELTWFSNYGQTKVNLAAPGASLYSTEGGNTYNTGSGTSFAAPMVAGACALVWANDTGLNHLQVKNKVLNGCEKISGLRDYLPGGRRLNLNNALTARRGRVPRSDLQGYWKFNQSGANIGNDRSGNNNDLRRSSNSPRSQTGRYFNAAKCVTRPDMRRFFKLSNSLQTGLHITDDLTISAWIKIEKLTKSGDEDARFMIMERGKDYSFFVKRPGRKLVFNIGSSIDGGDPSEVVGSTKLALDVWYHVVVRVKDSNMYLYVNGIEDGSGTIANRGSTDDTKFFIGKGDKTREVSKGLYDDVAIWSKALSAEKIRKLYSM